MFSHDAAHLSTSLICFCEQQRLFRSRNGSTEISLIIKKATVYTTRISKLLRSHFPYWSLATLALKETGALQRGYAITFIVELKYTSNGDLPGMA